MQRFLFIKFKHKDIFLHEGFKALFISECINAGPTILYSLISNELLFCTLVSDIWEFSMPFSLEKFKWNADDADVNNAD